MTAPQASDSVPRGRGPRTRARASHSLESVLAEAVAILDESGPPGLTIRALAARLGGGAASIYWYVSGRDELLDLAADSVLAAVSAEVAGIRTDDPIDDLRTIAVAMFDAIVDRPWLGAYALRNTGAQQNSLALYERVGEQTQRLDLTTRQRFYATSAVVGFVIGTAADMGQEPPAEVISGEVSRDEYLARATDRWRALDAASFPFIHEIVDEFAGHDDAEQFRAGLDLLRAPPTGRRRSACRQPSRRRPRRPAPSSCRRSRRRASRAASRRAPRGRTPRARAARSRAPAGASVTPCRRRCGQRFGNRSPSTSPFVRVSPPSQATRDPSNACSERVP
ncbi:MAG TPA: TetR family transcriptional regulator [Microbacterium sp.]|nr:TetR family transcriptional regulator [Microbacterium sp.]